MVSRVIMIYRVVPFPTTFSGSRVGFNVPGTKHIIGHIGDEQPSVTHNLDFKVTVLL